MGHSFSGTLSHVIKTGDIKANYERKSFGNKPSVTMVTPLWPCMAMEVAQCNTSIIICEEKALVSSFADYLTFHSEHHQTSMTCMKRTCEIEIVLSLKMSHTVAHTHSIVNTDIKDSEKR